MSEPPEPRAGVAARPEQPPPPGTAHQNSQPSRTQRRVERTRALIEDAFVALAAERGVESVSVEDIAAHADLAKATFYAHYANKEALQAAVFARLAEELASRVAYRDGPWTQVRRSAVTASFEHARDMKDLYRACLADPRARNLYTRDFAAYAEQNFSSRLEALGRKPRVPANFMATAFAGAHVALIDAWLQGDLDGTPMELASMELDLLIAGFAWAHNLSLDEIDFRPNGQHP
jgi:AcrR family transcriptional regulator